MMTRERDTPVAAPAHSRLAAAVELPTLALICIVYAGWLAITACFGSLSMWILAPVGALVVTLHGSLQHEIIHGHPTRSRRFNRVLGMVPLALWLPFEHYRRSHLAHHINDRLTDPHDDPESFYWTRTDWQKIGAFGRTLVRWQQTLAGRVLFGSWLQIGRFLHAEFGLLRRSEAESRAIWSEHVLWCVPVVLWLKFVCAMPLWIYFVCIVVPANGILLIRSFAEHRARGEVLERTAIVEGSRVLGPLFLFNNLHALHHAEPLIPWYDYNRRYRATRERLIAENGGLVYAGYLEVARRYLLRAHDLPEHPTGRVPALRSRPRTAHPPEIVVDYSALP
jgi:fatty acid desaturase